MAELTKPLFTLQWFFFWLFFLGGRLFEELLLLIFKLLLIDLYHALSYIFFQLDIEIAYLFVATLTLSGLFKIVDKLAFSTFPSSNDILWWELGVNFLYHWPFGSIRAIIFFIWSYPTQIIVLWITWCGRNRFLIASDRFKRRFRWRIFIIECVFNDIDTFLARRRRKHSFFGLILHF